MPNTSYCDSNTILIGLGGTGGKILRAFKMRMFEEFPTPEERAKIPVSLIYVDSTDEMMPKDGRPHPDFRVLGQDASFERSEFFNIKTQDISYVLDHINSYPALKGIISNAASVKNAIGNLGEAAGQKRRAGRILFAINATGYVKKLKEAYGRCSSISGDGNTCNIYIFAGLCGGTGSGSIIDAIVQARKTFPSANIAVYAMIPEMNLPKADIDQGRYYQNGYAALNELNALQANRFHPHDVTGDGESTNLYSLRYNGVANGITLYSNVNENGVSLNSFKELPKIVSDFVFARIFYIKNEAGDTTQDIVRAYSYENCTDFAQEYDESAQPSDTRTELPIARTKKINTFGIKRVMYPELRILKHTTYTVGEAVLRQFKYNNWREDVGFVNEEQHKDLREAYLNDANIGRWLLDINHLTLDQKILPTDKADLHITSYWDDKAHTWAEAPDIKKAACPLTALDSELKNFFDKEFGQVGVETFYENKRRAIPEMALEIRHVIEKELYEKWAFGEISINELLSVSRLLLEKIDDIRADIDKRIDDNLKEVAEIESDCSANVTKWSNLSILQRLANVGNRIYGQHQTDLSDLYTARTMTVALQFAKTLGIRVKNVLENMLNDVSSFANLISDAIEETEKMISAQNKQNKGIEDMKGAIIEVSEEDEMQKFEQWILTSRTDMNAITSKIRKAILPTTQFTNFGQLLSEVSLDNIRDAFDLQLSEVIKQKHSELPESSTKILGLNILTQLQQQLPNDEEIRAFCAKIMRQSGVYLRLDDNQLQQHVPNNDLELSPSNPASINKKVIYVSIPAPENDRMAKFVSSLEQAFKGAINSGNDTTTIAFDKTSPRKNELSVIIVKYLFPMRCVEWLADYRKRYERFINTPNEITNANNRILLHSEGDGSELPPLFVLSDEEIAKQKAQKSPQEPAAPTVPPAAPGAVPPPIQPEAELKLFVAVNGQSYGPYTRDVCKQMVANKQLTPQSVVWQEGMAAWAAAETVPELKSLFAPPAAPGMPPMPPTGVPGMPPLS
jgi:hypothetical protein